MITNDLSGSIRALQDGAYVHHWQTVGKVRTGTTVYISNEQHGWSTKASETGLNSVCTNGVFH